MTTDGLWELRNSSNSLTCFACFDMLELNKKVIVNEEFKSFIEFCYLLGIMLKIDEAQVESYFSKEKPITNNLDALVAVTQLLQN